MNMQTITQGTDDNTSNAALLNTIGNMNAISEEGFNGIANLAHLALIALESPTVYDHLESLAAALDAIREKSEVYARAIDSEAEQASPSCSNASSVSPRLQARQAHAQATAERNGRIFLARQRQASASSTPARNSTEERIA